MKQFNLKIEKRALSFGDLNVVVLWERGRGRYETLVPVQGDILPSDSVIAMSTKSGKIKLVKGGDTSGWIANISAQGIYTRGTEGYVYAHNKDYADIVVLASGHGAEGDAGRIGYWEQFLLQIPDHSIIRVKPHGGYKTPPDYLYFGETEVHRMDSEEYIILCDNHDIEVDPENFETTFTKLKTNHKK